MKQNHLISIAGLVILWKYKYYVTKYFDKNTSLKN
jgi:hypothetical protein